MKLPHPYSIDHVDWPVALAHYDAERLDAAYETALDVGMGGHSQYLTWYRTIEAEALTAQRSRTLAIDAITDLEFVEEEVGERAEFVAATALEAFADVGSRFGYRHESRTRLTVLAVETDAPWLFGRHGYCIAKTGFYKICIPFTLISSPTEMAKTLRHEYAHVAAGTLSQRRSPRWLEEAVAMQAEGGVPKSQARLFATGEEEWLDPGELEADLRELDDTRDKWLAYLQSGLIGGYLTHLKGEASIGRLLTAFGRGSAWSEFLARLRGAPLEELPIRRIYGLSLDRLFAQAREWVRAAR